MDEEAEDDADRGRMTTVDSHNEGHIETDESQANIHQDLLRLLCSEFSDLNNNVNH